MDTPATPHPNAPRQKHRGTGKLSTRLLLAYASLVAIYFILMMAPVQLLLKRDYVAEAAAAFEDALATHSDELAAAAEKDDRIALDMLCETLNTEFQGRVTLFGVDGSTMADSISARCLARAKPECIPAIYAQRQRALQSYMPLDDTVTVRLPVNLGARGPSTVRLALPLHPVRAKQRRMTGLLVVTACAAMALAIAVGILVSKHIAKPVEQMIRVAERIAKGDFECTPPTGGTDEIGRLAQALTNMQTSLRDNLTQLARERNQAVAIVQHLSDGVIAVDAHNTVLFANEAAGNLLGEPKLQPGKPLETQSEVLETIALARRRKAEAACEIGEARHDRQVLRIRATPVAGKAPEAANVIVVATDMTEARRTENLGRELVANASHELRTPLAVIASSAETLMASPDSPARDRREFLEIIARQADRLERLVSDTLHLSQLDSSMPHEALQKMPLQDVVNDVMTALKPAAQQREIRLLNEMGTEDARTEIYPSALRQAVSNLVDNAIRYTQAGGTVAVSIETGDDMTILVRDTGPGIQPADHKRIFERFVRGPQRAAEDVEGSGMGLAIVKRVAEVHGGRIEVESTPEKGSCFKLILPRKAPPDTL